MSWINSSASYPPRNINSMPSQKSLQVYFLVSHKVVMVSNSWIRSSTLQSIRKASPHCLLFYFSIMQIPPSEQPSHWNIITEGTEDQAKLWVEWHIFDAPLTGKWSCKQVENRCSNRLVVSSWTLPSIRSTGTEFSGPAITQSNHLTLVAHLTLKSGWDLRTAVASGLSMLFTRVQEEAKQAGGQKAACAIN